MAILLTGCFQTAQIQTAQHNYYLQRYEEAARRLDSEEIPKRDAMLALLEKGMALQATGNYSASAEAWRRAAELMDKQDIFHLGEQAFSLLADQNFLSYQPAPYEQPILHAMLSLNYLMIPDVQAARVEALQALKNLDEREKDFGPILIAHYAAALAFERAGDLNDAFIEYRKLHDGGVPGFARKLESIAARLGFEDRRAYFAERGLDTAESNAMPSDRVKPVLFLVGRSPVKVSSEIVISEEYRIVLPVFQPRAASVRGVRSAGVNSVMLTSVETLAANYSGKLFASELLKEIIRRKAQRHLVRKVGDKVGSTTENLLKTVLFFATEADLRTWSSLPASFQLGFVPEDAPVTEMQFQKIGADGREVEGPVLNASPAKSETPLLLLRAW